MHEALLPLEELAPLRDPVLIAAFSGWGDMGGAAVATVDYLIEQWNARLIAEIDPQPFYDFTVQRPRVRLEGDERVTDWPANRFYLAQPPGADRDFVLLAGIEPSLRWRTFTEVVAELMRAVGATTSITLGAQPAAVPHTRPLPVTLSASDPSFEEQFSLKAPASRYQGPTGIVGVMNLHHRSLHWRNASLWAMVPHYLTMGPSPHAAITLIKTLDHGFHTSTALGPLDDRAEMFAVQVREAMDQSADAEGYVRQLEEQYDSSPPEVPGAAQDPRAGGGELPASEDLIGDLERFLRERREPGDAQGPARPST